MNSPVLALADYMKDFLLKKDASKEGLGAVLSQKQADGQFHLVVYGSQTLSAHEKNYHSTKLEFLALKWAITEHFKEYLLYQPFLVKTDNNLLTYIMTTLNLDTTETGRWTVSSSSLWQPGIISSGEELPFHQIRVSGIEMGHYRTFQRISVIPTLPG